MAASSHKLDLERVGCAYLEVRFGALDDESVTQSLDEYLDDGVAAGSYSRRGNRFGVFVAVHEHEGPPEYQGSWFPLPQEGGTPARVGDPWSALGLLFETVQHADISCSFHVASDREPKLAIPIALFSSGAFPFNELHGYRAALVDDGRTIWTAIVDQVDSPKDFAVSVRFADYSIQPSTSSRDLLTACTDVRDQLMQEPRDG